MDSCEFRNDFSLSHSPSDLTSSTNSHTTNTEANLDPSLSFPLIESTVTAVSTDPNSSFQTETISHDSAASLFEPSSITNIVNSTYLSKTDNIQTKSESISTTIDQDIVAKNTIQPKTKNKRKRSIVYSQIEKDDDDSTTASLIAQADENDSSTDEIDFNYLSKKHRQLHQYQTNTPNNEIIIETSQNEEVTFCMKSPLNRSKKSKALPEKATNLMKEWYEANKHNPYPTDEERRTMAENGNITENQVKAWFANKRNRSSKNKSKIKDSKSLISNNQVNIQPKQQDVPQEQPDNKTTLVNFQQQNLLKVPIVQPSANSAFEIINQKTKPTLVKNSLNYFHQRPVQPRNYLLNESNNNNNLLVSVKAAVASLTNQTYPMDHSENEYNSNRFLYAPNQTNSYNNYYLYNQQAQAQTKYSIDLNNNNYPSSYSSSSVNYFPYLNPSTNSFNECFNTSRFYNYPNQQKTSESCYEPSVACTPTSLSSSSASNYDQSNLIECNNTCLNCSSESHNNLNQHLKCDTPPPLIKSSSANSQSSSLIVHASSSSSSSDNLSSPADSVEVIFSTSNKPTLEKNQNYHLYQGNSIIDPQANDFSAYNTLDSINFYNYAASSGLSDYVSIQRAQNGSPMLSDSLPTEPMSYMNSSPSFYATNFPSNNFYNMLNGPPGPCGSFPSSTASSANSPSPLDFNESIGFISKNVTFNRSTPTAGHQIKGFNSKRMNYPILAQQQSGLIKTIMPGDLDSRFTDLKAKEWCMKSHPRLANSLLNKAPSQILNYQNYPTFD